ncbi:MAG: hypothetical protein EAZ94_19710 [Oscillatoriales cyanobacterium]|nr:MAG: hypothetical protein EAZ94_19710 [Oscillatoriales cyanobacterium]TAE20639.1 MAG: hypothetical protein EAZ93_22905 [Oscillatoriales cyanobacterium]
MTNEKILMQKFSYHPGCRNQAFLPKDWVAGSRNAKKPAFEASEVRRGQSFLAKTDYTGRDGQNRDCRSNSGFLGTPLYSNGQGG